ncbi:putative uncharacterized protein [Prevotella sp. CAG:1185]|nr:putative uncharacterized protein [Prevotella sp. CAG:1185]
MKTFKYLATTATCILMSLGIHAQKNINNAIDDFVNNKNYEEYIKKEVTMEQNSPTDKSFCYTYTFELPANKSKALNRIYEAFDKDASNAYNLAKRSSGISNEELLRIGYGRDLDKTIALGTHIDRNYEIMLFRDSNDSLYRYVYAIVWKEKVKEDKVWGIIYKVYGKDPKKVNSTFTRTIMKSNGEIITINNKNGQIITHQIEPLSSDNNVYTNNQDVIIRTGDSPIKTNMDFLRRFGNLRVAYNAIQDEGGANKLTICTGIVNKILELCKSSGNLLSESEKTVCIDSMKEIQKHCKDNYLKALLNEAINELK